MNIERIITQAIVNYPFEYDQVNAHEGLFIIIGMIRLGLEAGLIAPDYSDKAIDTLFYYNEIIKK